MLQQSTATRLDDDLPGIRETAKPDLLTLPRRPLCLFFGGAAILIPLLGLAGLWSALALLCLSALIATAIAPAQGRSTGRLFLVHWLCAALPLALLGVTGVGLFAHWRGISVWQDQASAMSAWALLVIIPLVTGWRRPRRVGLAQSKSEVLVVSTILALCTSIVVAQPFELWARVVGKGTDFPRHVAMVGTLISDGALDYSANPYPRSAHAAVAALQSAAGDATVAGSWQATEGLLLLMLALIAAASALLSMKVMRVLGGPAWLAAVAAPVLVAWLVLTGPWVSDMVPAGFLTSFEAGLIVAAAALLFWDGMQRISPAATMGLIGLTALLANTWLLLVPLLALPTLRIAWIGWRRSARLPIIVSAEVGLMLAMPVTIASVRMLGLDAASIPGGTTLPGIGLVWLALLGVSGAGIVALSRGGADGPARSLVLLVVGLVAVLAFLVTKSDGTAYGSYYLIKTAWTPLGLLLALAVPFVLYMLWRVRGWMRLLLAAVAAAAILTQPASAADSVRAIRGEEGLAPLAIPMLDQLGLTAADRVDPPDVLVWGLAPHLSANLASIKEAGRYDNVAQGTLVLGGYGMSDGERAKALIDHDPVAICDYLAEHVDVMRVTGPYPEGPIQWLLDSGCPDAVVRPGSWVSIDVDPTWFTGTESEGMPYGQDYATWAEAKPFVAAIIRDREEQDAKS